MVGFIGSGVVKAADKPVKIGFVSIFSGRVAFLGKSFIEGMTITAEAINKRGGLLGRPIEIIHRDSKGKPEEAVKIARDFIERDKVDFFFDGCTSREAFAVKEVTRDLKFLTFTTGSETTAFTADPKIFSKYNFRVSRMGLHDAVSTAIMYAKVAKRDKLKKWYSFIPDYAFGRDYEAVMFHHLKQYYPEVKVLGSLYPRLFQPDYTPYITTILAAKPDALFSVVWGGDLTAFIKQATVYGLFHQMRFFSFDLSDVINSGELRPIPVGRASMIRHARNVPDTALNHDYYDRYVKRWGVGPTNYSYEGSSALLFLEAAVKKAGTLDHEDVAKALRGITIKSPCGQPPEGTLTMRAKDQTAIHYVQAFGYTTSKPPYFKDIQYIDWDEILKAEAPYLKMKGWLK